MTIYPSIIAFLVLFGAALFYLLSSLGRNATEPKIIGGTDVSIAEFPFMVALKFRNASPTEPIFQKVICGGSIIGSKWILTAAHCKPENVTIDGFLRDFYFRAGSTHHNSGGTEIAIKRYIEHPGHNGTVNEPWMFDLAIIETVHEIQFNNRTQPIALAVNRPPVNSTVTVLGWGRIIDLLPVHSPVLQKLQMPTISIEQCSETIYSDERAVCTLPARYTGPCSGDSGAPLIYNNTVVGVFSQTPEHCDIGHVDSFVSVAYFHQWIHNVTGIV